MESFEQNINWEELQSILDSGLLRFVILGIPDELCQYIIVDAGDKVYYQGDELYDGSHIQSVPFKDSEGTPRGARIFSGNRLTSNDLSREYTVIDVEVPSGLWGALRKICAQPIANSLGIENNIFLLPDGVSDFSNEP